jgi:hypothetical protein
MQQTPTLDKRIRDALADWRKADSDDWDSGFLGLVSRYVPWFDAERIEYAFTDSVAVQLHGGEPQGKGAYLVVTPASWQRLLQTQGTTFIAEPEEDGRSLSVIGSWHASPVEFLDSLDGIRACIHGVWVLSLPYLIDNALLRPSTFEREIVTSLIRANGLDETFQKSLSTRSRRAHYLACLAEARKRPMT